MRTLKLFAAIVVAILCAPVWAQEPYSRHDRADVRVGASVRVGSTRVRVGVEVRRGERDRRYEHRSRERSRYDDRRYDRGYYPPPETRILRAPVTFGRMQSRPDPRPRVEETRAPEMPRYKMQTGEIFIVNETSCLVTVGSVRTGKYILLEPGAGTTTFWEVQDLVAETLDRSDRTYGPAQITVLGGTPNAFKVVVN
ncbi:MAG: hypothetical protein AAB463_00400 [Patescibacteria group bacterium]